MGEKNNDPLAGTFVETAFTGAEVDAAIALEQARGRPSSCAFLDGDVGGKRDGNGGRRDDGGRD